MSRVVVWGDAPVAWQEVVEVARHDAELVLSESAWQRIARGREIVTNIVASGRSPMASTRGWGRCAILCWRKKS